MINIILIAILIIIVALIMETNVLDALTQEHAQNKKKTILVMKIPNKLDYDQNKQNHYQ